VDDRNKFSLPPHLSLKNLEALTKAAGGTADVHSSGSKFGKHFSDLFDQAVCWDTIAWLKSISPLPLLIKGVLAPDDARRAVELGVDGIILSNHGGRQLNYAPAAVDMLPACAAAVQGRVPLLVDGGISRGTGEEEKAERRHAEQAWTG
jgi:(S)-2-hydroxy-acid oxidase